MTISADHTAQQPAAAEKTAPAGNAAGDAVRKFGITVEDYMLPARHPIQIVGPDGALNPHTEQGAR
jgi:2-oxoisovalerate dehydrogenase E1 component alpha subunit